MVKCPISKSVPRPGSLWCEGTELGAEVRTVSVLLFSKFHRNQNIGYTHPLQKLLKVPKLPVISQLIETQSHQAEPSPVPSSAVEARPSTHQFQALIPKGYPAICVYTSTSIVHNTSISTLCSLYIFEITYIISKNVQFGNLYYSNSHHM